MVKMLVVFVLIFLLTYAGIKVFQALTKAEKWDFVKTSLFSIGVAGITLVIMTAIVVLF